MAELSSVRRRRGGASPGQDSIRGTTYRGGVVYLVSAAGVGRSGGNRIGAEETRLAEAGVSSGLTRAERHGYPLAWGYDLRWEGRGRRLTTRGGRRFMTPRERLH